MPKIKTSRAAAKRFKKTGSGQLKRMKELNKLMMLYRPIQQHHRSVRLRASR